MKKFKQIDCWVNIGLIIIAVVYGLTMSDYRFILGYFIVGGWQVISMFIHAVNGWFCAKGSARYIYHRIILITLIIMPVSFIFYPLLFLILVALLVASPFMAVWYAWLCYDELYVKMKRPLALLK